jgi:DNA invertase Pin-like site-specific DNA recombinase
MQYAISYRRFSSPSQGSGDSQRRQTDLAAEFCRREDIKLLNTYLDAGMSAFRGEHLSDKGALGALLDQAKAGKFQPGTLLIVESLDRLSRLDMSAALRLFLDILDTGLVILALIEGEHLFTKEKVDSDPVSLIYAIVILSRANNQSRVYRERAQKSWEAKRKRAREHNTPLTTKCPPWLRVAGTGDDRRFVVNKGRAEIIKQICQLGIAGFGQEQTIRYLNRAGIPPFSRAAKWRRGMIPQIFRTRAVIGVYQPFIYTSENGKRRRVRAPEDPIEGYYPAIISQSLLDQYIRSLRARDTRQGKRNGIPTTNLLSRMGRCATCGDTLELGTQSRGFDYLVCVSGKQKECANQRGFPIHALEPLLLVLDDLVKFVADLAPDFVTVDAECFSPFGSFHGFRQAKERALFPDKRERHLGRAALAAELRSLIEGIVLHEDRSLTVHANPELLGCEITLMLSPQGFEGIRIKLPEGQTGFISASVFQGAMRPLRLRRRGPRGTTDPPLWDALDGPSLLQRTHIIHSPNGDWHAMTLKPALIDDIAQRGENTLLRELPFGSGRSAGAGRSARSRGKASSQI